MASRQVIEVPSTSVGGSLYSIAVCSRGVDMQKVYHLTFRVLFLLWVAYAEGVLFNCAVWLLLIPLTGEFTSLNDTKTADPNYKKSYGIYKC